MGLFSLSEERGARTAVSHAGAVHVAPPPQLVVAGRILWAWRLYRQALRHRIGNGDAVLGKVQLCRLVGVQRMRQQQAVYPAPAAGRQRLVVGQLLFGQQLLQRIGQQPLRGWRKRQVDAFRAL